ncbi:MAG: MaoC family dehydratase [Acidimicrobiales bacterium]|nr:MaoC family dehydratase [Acidimicrobiales bacterium]
MSENAQKAFEVMQNTIGLDPVAGEWFEITQERINDFADATIDHQFIHVDIERASQTPFGGTIAHGFLTLSMLVHLSTSIPVNTSYKDIGGVLMGINYGLNKVRFINPVSAGSRVRATSQHADVVLKGNAVDLTRKMTVEIEGQDKPALIAEWIGRTVFS